MLAEAHISILNAKIYMLLQSKRLKIMKSAKQNAPLISTMVTHCNLNGLIIPI